MGHLSYEDDKCQVCNFRMVSRHRDVAEGLEQSLKSELEVSGAFMDRVRFKQRRSSDRLPSFWRVVANTFGSYYMLGGLFFVLYTIINFISPALLK